MESASVHAKQRGTISRKGAKQRTSELLKSEGVGVFVGVIEVIALDAQARSAEVLRCHSPAICPPNLSGRTTRPNSHSRSSRGTRIGTEMLERVFRNESLSYEGP